MIRSGTNIRVDRTLATGNCLALSGGSLPLEDSLEAYGPLGWGRQVGALLMLGFSRVETVICASGAQGCNSTPSQKRGDHLGRLGSQAADKTPFSSGCCRAKEDSFLIQGSLSARQGRIPRMVRLLWGEGIDENQRSEVFTGLGKPDATLLSVNAKESLIYASKCEAESIGGAKKSLDAWEGTGTRKQQKHQELSILRRIRNKRYR
jgi:hypothetical protein